MQRTFSELSFDVYKHELMKYERQSFSHTSAHIHTGWLTGWECHMYEDLFAWNSARCRVSSALFFFCAGRHWLRDDPIVCRGFLLHAQWVLMAFFLSSAQTHSSRSTNELATTCEQMRASRNEKRNNANNVYYMRCAVAVVLLLFHLQIDKFMCLLFPYRHLPMKSLTQRVREEKT